MTRPIQIKKITVYLLTIVVSLVLLNSYYFNYQNKNEVLDDCIAHGAGGHHIHVTLKIDYLGKDYPIPLNVGVEENCMHPISTHDTSGRVHVDYPQKIDFTLGDVFITMGTMFNKYQLGATFIGERYALEMSVNGMQNRNFDNYILKNEDEILIKVYKR